MFPVSKETGSGSRHAWQASASAISALSYLVIQVFEKTAPSRFQSIHRSKADIRANTYLHLPSIQFLCRLQGEVTFTDPQTILITKTDWTTFPRLSKCLSALGSAFKELNGGFKGKKEGKNGLKFLYVCPLVVQPSLYYFHMKLTTIST